MARIIGTTEDDSLSGPIGEPNRITGRIGDDTLIGGDLADTLIGGGGDDRLEGTSGADRLIGSSGFDIASYQSALAGVRVSTIDPSTNSGAAAGDRYAGIEGILGSRFDDTLFAFSEAGSGVLLDGGSGDDFIDDAIGSAVLLAGDDTLIGGDGDDTMFAGPGDDTLIGGAGGDGLDGETGFDIASYALATRGLVVSLSQPFRNTGEATGDSLGGIDGLIGSDFADLLLGGNNSDTLPANRFEGGGGNDTIEARDGDDILLGDEGRDSLVGGKGNDTLSGGAGKETLRGGGDADTFLFTKTGQGIDVIAGFDASEDRFALDVSGFGLSLPPGALDPGAFIASAAGEATGAGPQIVYDTDDGVLLLDRDGAGGEAAIRFARVQSAVALTLDAFTLIA